MITGENLSDFLRSHRNRIDFFLRELFTFSLPVRETGNRMLHHEERVRKEIAEYLEGFAWKANFPAPCDRGTLRVLDIGCRNFYLAPLLYDFFSRGKGRVMVHGIELDAYRRYRDFRTRADYGNYYASTIPGGEFHAGDFLDWRETFEIGIVFNPFVTKDPLLAWGLHLNNFDPHSLFAHARNRCRGLFFVSHPTEEELAIGLRLAKEVGFTLLEQRSWHPSATSAQRYPRYGFLAK